MQGFRALPLLLSLALVSPGRAAAAQPVDAFRPSLLRLLIGAQANECAVAFGDQAEDIYRIAQGWEAKNAKVLALWDARVATLTQARRDALGRQFREEFRAWRLKMGEEQAKGHAATACASLFEAYDTMPMLPAPPAPPAP